MSRRYQLEAEACLQCGAPAARDARFCVQCGSRLSSPPREELRQSGERPRLPSPAERRQVTLLFCDLIGSTELATHIDPEEMRDVMAAYQAACAQAIEPFEGRIAQTLGDGLLVYFGYPEAHEDDAQRAVRAALAIIAVVGSQSGELHALWPAGAVRIGIHTGLVIAGEVGPWDTRLGMALTGETPNIAARLQDFAGRNQLVIGPTTRRLIGDSFELEELGPRVIKGVHEPLPIWRVVGPIGGAGRVLTRSRNAGTPLVGRDVELAALREHWQRACEGDGQLLVLSGAAGIGKSRLAEAFRVELREQGAVCMQYHCSPYFQNTALYPMVAYVQQTAGIRIEDRADLKLRKLRRLLGPLTPGFARDLALLGRLLQIPASQLPPLEERSAERLLEDTIEVLIERALAVTRSVPALFLLEDAHWIDRTTMRLLSAFCRRLPGARVLAIVTHRSEFDAGWSHGATIPVLRLERLSPRDSGSIVQHLAGHDLPEPLQHEIIARSDGIPLFIEELTKAVLESRDGDVVPTVPASLRDSLVARLDRLGSLKRVAQLGACIGRTFPYRLLLRVSDWDEPQLHEGLQRLVDAGLLSCVGDPPDATFSFKHALLQSASYESLLRSERKQVHAEIASDLTRYYPQSCENEPEVVAHHLTEAGEHTGAVEYWSRAGRLAQQRSAHFDAIAHLGAGIRSLRELPASRQADEKEVELLLALNRSHMALGGWTSPRVLEVTSRARVLSMALGDPVKQSEALFGQFTYHCARGEFAACRGLAEEFVPLAEATADRTLLLMADTVALVTYFCLGEFKQAQRHAARVHENYRPDEDRALVESLNHDPEVFAWLYEGFWLWVQGFPDSAERASRRAVELARSRRHPFQLCFALCQGSIAWLFRRELAPVAAAIEECLLLAKEHRIPTFRVYGPLMGAPALIERDPTPAMLARLRRCAAAMHASGAGMHVPLYLIQVAEAHERLGEFTVAEELTLQALAMIESTGERWIEPELCRVRARLLRGKPEPDDGAAEHWLRDGLLCARQLNARGFELRLACDLAELLASRGGKREATALLEPVLRSFDEGRGTADLLHAERLLDAFTR